MEYAVLGWPPDGPPLELDWRRFSYAGKFVMSNTGKAIAKDDGEIVAAIAFNADRTDEATAWLRYITVRSDRKGEGIGVQLASYTVDQLLARDFETVQIAVNNPFAYEALYRAGFGYIGEETGLAELVLRYGVERDLESYRSGLQVFEDRELSPGERAFLDEKQDRDEPPRQRDSR